MVGDGEGKGRTIVGSWQVPKSIKEYPRLFADLTPAQGISSFPSHPPGPPPAPKIPTSQTETLRLHKFTRVLYYCMIGMLFIGFVAACLFAQTFARLYLAMDARASRATDDMDES
jgi:hypothetical protein